MKKLLVNIESKKIVGEVEILQENENSLDVKMGNKIITIFQDDYLKLAPIGFTFKEEEKEEAEKDYKDAISKIASIRLDYEPVDDMQDTKQIMGLYIKTRKTTRESVEDIEDFINDSFFKNLQYDGDVYFSICETEEYKESRFEIYVNVVIDAFTGSRVSDYQELKGAISIFKKSNKIR